MLQYLKGGVGQFGFASVLNVRLESAGIPRPNVVIISSEFIDPCPILLVYAILGWQRAHYMLEHGT